MKGSHFGGRPKDLEDIRLLEALRRRAVKPLERPDERALAWVRGLAQRRLSAEEFRAALAVPLGSDEADEARSLIRWFRRRHPTPAERLAYARRAYARWSAGAARD